MERARIAYFGSDAICLPGLRYLREACSELCELSLIVSQPDRRQGRGRQLRQNPVAAYAKEQGIPVLQPEKPGRTLAEQLRAEEITLAFVMAYGHFLGKSLREAPLHGMLNFHGSLLPKYRGASPVETALAVGEQTTGVCLMAIDREMDAGAVADCEPVIIREQDTSPDLRARVGEAVVPLLRRNLSAALVGKLTFEPQDAAAASFCRKINKQDGALDFHQPAHLLDCRLRAFTPWPGGFFEHEGMTIKVGRAEALPVPVDDPPGTVLRVGETCDVATSQGVIRLHELQRPGGRLLPARDFFRGFPLAPGTQLSSVKNPPLLKERDRPCGQT
ncbi:MAG: methionyl-tRNA formyltransferase [Opitutales bacterium]